MKILKSALILGLIAQTPSFAQEVSQIDVLRAFDGKSVSCQNQDDYLRSMRTGAYIVKNAKANINDEQKINLALDVDTYRCNKIGNDQYSWEEMGPNDSYEYPQLIFEDSGSRMVNVKVEKKNSQLTAISDDYLVLSAAPITAQRSGAHTSNLTIDLSEAIGPKQATQLDDGASVKIRVGIFNKADIRRSIPGRNEQSFQSANGGMFYIFLKVTKDQQDFKIQIEK